MQQFESKIQSITARYMQFPFNDCVQLYLPSAVSEPENHSIPNNYHYIL